MSKAILVDAVVAKTGQSKTAATATIDAVTDAITEVLARGEKISLTGFASFEVKHRAAAKGRNPATGAEIDVPAKNVVKFRAGKALEDAVANAQVKK